MGENNNFEDFKLDLPTRKSYSAPKPKSTETVEVSVDSTEKSVPLRVPPVDSFSKYAPKDERKQIKTSRYSGGSSAFNRRQTQVRDDGETVLEYDRAGTVHHVVINNWAGSYGFYEKFVVDAVKSNAAKLPDKPVPHVAFFSYIPQYSSLHPTQWRYYLYFKKCVRDGVILPEADFSYILLYVYEILNLEGVISPSAGADLLGTVWAMYRSRHVSLDKYLSEWMIDYCLIHNIPLPKSVTPFIHMAAAHSLLREFYVDTALVAGSWKELSVILVSCLSDYNPSKSRFGENVEGFSDKIYEKLVPVVRGMAEGNIGIFETEGFKAVTVKRDAYCGSLCACSVKKRLILSLHSPFRATENRKLMTDIVKKCENLVRGELGARSRLAAPSVKDGEISALFASLYGDEHILRRKQTPEEAEYMKYYDSPNVPLTTEKAAEIEAESWKNTEILAEDFSAYDEEEAVTPEGAVTFDGENDSSEKQENISEDEGEKTDSSFASLLKSKDGQLFEILKNTAIGAKSFGDGCRECGLFADRAAEEINELSQDTIGDIILEGDGSSYEIIEDYIDEILQ